MAYGKTQLGNSNSNSAVQDPRGVEYSENVTPEMIRWTLPRRIVNFISLFSSATDIPGGGDPCNVSTNGLTHVRQPGQISYLGGSTLRVMCEPGWQYSNIPLDVQRQYTCNNGAWSNNFADCIRNWLFCNLKPIEALCTPAKILETGNSHHFFWGNQQKFYLNSVWLTHE